MDGWDVPHSPGFNIEEFQTRLKEACEPFIGSCMVNERSLAALKSAIAGTLQTMTNLRHMPPEYIVYDVWIDPSNPFTLFFGAARNFAKYPATRRTSKPS